MTGKEVEAALGTGIEIERGEFIEEGATGLTVQEWTVPGDGLRLKMGAESEEQTQRLQTIEIGQGSPLKTDRAIGIGSTRNEVMDAYGAEISEENQSGLEKGNLVAGSIYDGVIFFFDDSDRVERIFVGAAAE